MRIVVVHKFERTCYEVGHTHVTAHESEIMNGKPGSGGPGLALR